MKNKNQQIKITPKLDQLFEQDVNNKKGLTMQRLKSIIALSLLTGSMAVSAAPPVTHYEYDANGNMTKITNGLGHATVQQYDALDRMIKQLQPNPEAAGQLGEITMDYNAIDQLKAVTDPRNLTTSYGLNALNDRLSLTSPDTGATINTYDEAGNLKTRQDAKGQLTTYSYDALNRLINISYADGQIITYDYDQGVNGVGRLYQITDSTGTTTYSYDEIGRIADEVRNLNGVAYTTSYFYNAQGQLMDIIYPTGLAVSYNRDTLGRISDVIQVATDNTEQTIIANITYLPFGGVKSFSYGNGRVFNRNYDTDYRIEGYTLGNKNINIVYDPASRIESLKDPANAIADKSFSYDNLDRITNMVTGNFYKSYTYDLTGNRTSQKFNINNYGNTIANNSNRILDAALGPTTNKQYTHDANGSITNDGSTQYTYDARGRLISTTNTAGTVQYGINALGQRVAKTVNGNTTIYHYDLNGQLIAETDAQGNVLEETIYLGNMPIAVIK